MIAAEALRRRLSDTLCGPLPGRAAQRRFAPELAYGRHYGPAPPEARPAAVLALLYPAGAEWHIPLILRPRDMTDHAGQISLPGGTMEPGESGDACALRETEEELGVPPERVQILGKLTPLYVFNSQFFVVPYVGLAETTPEFRCNPQEVARLLQVPVRELLDPASYGEHTVTRPALTFRAPHITFEQLQIWGATSMILGELIAILRAAIGQPK